MNPGRQTSITDSSAVGSAAVLGSCIGKVVRCIRHALYFYNDEPDESDIGDVEISFTDASHILLSLNSDGETSRVTTDDFLIQPAFPVDGGRCEWRERQLSNEPEWSALVGSTLESAQAMIDRIVDSEPFVSGWCLTFTGAHTLIYYNCGDDARILIDSSVPTEPSLTTKFVSISELKRKS